MILVPAGAQFASQHLCERGAARDMVLPQLALRLVHRHRGTTAEVGAVERRVDLALVQRVSVLVQRAEQRLHVAVVVASGQAHVAFAHPCREWVSGGVHSPALLLDSEAAQRACHRGLLGGHWYLQGAARRVDRRLADEWRERICERPEDMSQLLASQPEVVVVEQRLIRALLAVGETVAIGPRKLHVAFQCGCERGEVVVCAGALPNVLALRTRLGEFHSQLFRYAPHSLPVAAREPHYVAIQLAECGGADRGSAGCPGVERLRVE